MSEQKPQLQYRLFTLDLSTARNRERRELAGEFLYVWAATDLAATVNVGFEADSADTIPIARRQGFRRPFSRLYITNAAQANKTLTLLVSSDQTLFDIIDNSATSNIGSVDSITQPVVKSQANGGATSRVTAGASAVQLVTAATGNRCVMVQNLDPTNIAWLGFSNAVTSANGFKCLAGSVITLDDYEGPLWTIRDSADVILAVAVMTRT